MHNKNRAQKLYLSVDRIMCYSLCIYAMDYMYDYLLMFNFVLVVEQFTIYTHWYSELNIINYI